VCCWVGHCSSPMYSATSSCGSPNTTVVDRRRRFSEIARVAPAFSPRLMESLLDQSRLALAVRGLKVYTLQARRLLRWAREPDQWRRSPVGRPGDYPHRLYQRQVAIARCDSAADPRFETGKRLNIAVAAPHFDGLTISPSQPLSFWRALGRPARSRGFAVGMELRGGCLIPTVGGGLCLLSNALFRTACDLGWLIIERHGHTLQASAHTTGELWGLDATVFWPQVDLRVAPRAREVLLSVTANAETLTIGVYGRTPRRDTVTLREISSATCGSIRSNRVERLVIDRGSKRVISRDVVAINRKRVLSAPAQRRNCMTCDEQRCNARTRLSRNYSSPSPLGEGPGEGSQ
jgi:vancomycin resistance protein VanW